METFSHFTEPAQLLCLQSSGAMAANVLGDDLEYVDAL